MDKHHNPKLIRITTVPISLKTLLKGQYCFMLANGFEVVGVSSPGQELQEVSADEGIRAVSIEMTRTISPLRDLKLLWQLNKLFRKEWPLIVHSHTHTIADVILDRIVNSSHRIDLKGESLRIGVLKQE